MKRIILILLIISTLLFSLPSCSSENVTRSGEVVSYGGDPLTFELACDNGKNYGYFIDDQTELIWEEFDSYTAQDDWDVFGINMYVTVVSSGKAEACNQSVDECVEGWYVAKSITVTKIKDEHFYLNDKPVIYLYPQETTEIRVKLDYDGILTCTYPRYENGWTVTAQPDGTLTDAFGQTYTYLYWEGISSAEYDFSQGFCIKGSDTAAFLEASLAQLGLSRKEANEFIVYWLPLMESNAYNLISFQTDAYVNSAKLTITPEPDTMLRVFMAWKPLTEEIEIEPQTLTAPDRCGFTVVEWGGTQIK